MPRVVGSWQVNPERNGGSRHYVDFGVFQVRFNRSQAGVHLRRPRPQPNGLDEELWLHLESRWGVATPFLQSIGPQAFSELRSRVVAGLTTTFASSYTSEVSLADVLDPGAFRVTSSRPPGRSFS